MTSKLAPGSSLRGAGSRVVRSVAGFGLPRGLPLLVSGVLVCAAGVAAAGPRLHRLGASTVLLPAASGGLFGRSLTTCDMNGDGFADVAVGGRSAVFVHLGGPDGVSATPVAELGDGDPLSAFGGALSCGDANGDGFGDLLVGAPGATVGADTQAGRAVLFDGGPAGPAPTPGWELAGAGVAGFVGLSVDAAGDVNGDGFDDLAVGGPSVQVFLGGASGPGVQPTAVLDVPATALATADVNGDGLDDLAIAESRADGAAFDVGRVAVYAGSGDGVAAAALVSFEGQEEGALLGSALANAGDVDGDGFDDLLIGAPDLDMNAGRDAAVYLAMGGPGGPDGLGDALRAASDVLTYGASLAGLGDTDADGHADFLVGAYTDGSGVGRVDVHLGPTAAWPADAVDTLAGEPGDFFGFALAGGDVNGDGYADALIGAPQARPDGQPQTGQVTVFLGYADADEDGAIVGGGRGTPQDCDDTRADVFPGAEEVMGDGVDQDCDGADLPADASDRDGPEADGDKSAGCATAPSGALPPLAGGLLGVVLVARGRRRR